MPPKSKSRSKDEGEREGRREGSMGDGRADALMVRRCSKEVEPVRLCGVCADSGNGPPSRGVETHKAGESSAKSQDMI